MEPGKALIYIQLGFYMEHRMYAIVHVHVHLQVQQRLFVCKAMFSRVIERRLDLPKQ